MERAPFVVKPAEHSPLRVVGETITVLANAKDTKSIEVFLQHGPEGAGPPPHTHPWDESYYVLEGQVDVMLGEKTVTLAVGEFVFIPAGTPHGFRMRSATAKFLSFNNAGGASAFFTELDREVKGENDIPKMMPIAQRHEVKIAPPPGR